jgi:hypothetical protein
MCPVVHHDAWLAGGHPVEDDFRLLRGMAIGGLLVLPFWLSLLGLMLTVS